MHDVDSYLPYVQHLHVQHLRLHESLLEVRRLFAVSPDPRQFSASFLASLESLRQELVNHFSEEETGGCLEESACRCPGLSSDIHQVFVQHSRLLADLDRLITRVRTMARDGSEWSMAEVRHDFDKFARALTRHESAENQILQRAFGSAADLDD